jgi:hypothetical protein
MSHPLLLDEMFSATIADQRGAKGHDARALVADPALVSLPDEQILAHATAAGRALVIANIKDFMRRAHPCLRKDLRPGPCLHDRDHERPQRPPRQA